MFWNLCSILREQTEAFKVSYFDFTPNQTLRERMEIEKATRSSWQEYRGGDGWIPSGGSRDEDQWIHKYFMKSVCEGGAID